MGVKRHRSKSDKVDSIIAYATKALAEGDKAIERLQANTPREIVEVAARSQAKKGVRPLGRPIKIVMTMNPSRDSNQSPASRKTTAATKQRRADAADDPYAGIEFVEEDPSPPREDPFEWSGKGNAWEDSVWLEKHFATGAQGERDAYQLAFELGGRIKRAHGKTFENLAKEEGILSLVQSAAEANLRLIAVLKELMVKHARYAPKKLLSASLIGASQRQKDAEQFATGSPEAFLDALIAKCADDWNLLQDRVDRYTTFAVRDLESRSASSMREFEAFARIVRAFEKSGQEISKARTQLLAGWMKICSAYWGRVIVIEKSQHRSMQQLRTTH